MGKRVPPIILALLSLPLSAATAKAATDLTITLSVIVAGNSVTYNASVCGKKPGSTFKTGLYFDRGTAPGCGATADHEWTVYGWGANCSNLTYTRTAVAAGSYTAWVLADNHCVVSEQSESNNTASKAYSVIPDLSVSAFTASVSGTTVTYSVTVKNSGVAISGPFAIGLTFDRATAPSCATTPDITLNLAGLGASQTTTQSHVRSGVPVGAYRAWALVDQGCTITEQDETNNAASALYDVGPNLYLLAPTVTVAGSQVTYAVTVCNQDSSADVGAYTVALWYDLASTPACSAAGADQVWSEPGLTKGSCKSLSHVRNGVPAGTFTAQVFADPSCAIAESHEEDNVRSKSYTVGAVAQADLTLSALTATSAGTDVTYKATVCNQGAGAGGGFTVGLYHDRASAPACSDAPSSSWSVPSLASGACQTLTTVRSGVADGSYLAWALADSGCAISEASEGNNTASASYTLGQPALTVSAFSASVTGTSVAFTVQVCSSGTAITTDFSVGIYVDRATAPDCAVAPEHSLLVAGGLGAGACKTLTATSTNVGAGTKQAWAFADHLCQIAEGNEGNNQRSYTYGVGVDAPDLKVTNFTVTTEGASATFVATVCNAGAAAAAASELGIFYDRTTAPQCGDAADWSSAVAGLAPGECETRTYKREGIAGGSYKAWARADVGCAVGESDETNNSASHAYAIQAQVTDLAVTALSASVSGERVTTIATICNQGSVKSPATVTGLFHDRQAAPADTCGDAPDQKATLDPLEPGGCTNQSWVRAKVPVGSYTAWAVADTECAVTESDEANNAASAPYTVGGAAGDAGVREAGADAGDGAAPGGCSCNLTGPAAPALGLLAGLLLAVAALLARRRR